MLKKNVFVRLKDTDLLFFFEKIVWFGSKTMLGKDGKVQKKKLETGEFL